MGGWWWLGGDGEEGGLEGGEEGGLEGWEGK